MQRSLANHAAETKVNTIDSSTPLPTAREHALLTTVTPLQPNHTNQAPIANPRNQPNTEMFNETQNIYLDSKRTEPGSFLPSPCPPHPIWELRGENQTPGH